MSVVVGITTEAYIRSTFFQKPSRITVRLLGQLKRILEIPDSHAGLIEEKMEDAIGGTVSMGMKKIRSSDILSVKKFAKQPGRKTPLE